ncbi:hypothetical protein ACFOOL_10705 [Devosia honganensis]|uniref:DUF2147 domain-containing protein n=1 Tax=Devosia honganensis TaxID=1610527 RepID=A0ABV7X0W4_9HYPH
MTIARIILAAGVLLGAAAAPALADPADINGRWMDAEGTTFTFSLCGDGTTLCGVLNDIQGESRTPENMAYVNQQVVEAEQIAPNRWEGTVLYEGRRAAAKVTLTTPDTVEITGCQVVIFCETLVFYRV